MKNQIEKLKPKIIGILKKHGVSRAGIFGSYAKGEENSKSDIDRLIELDGSLLKIVEIQFELEDSLNKKVDLITYGGLGHYLKGKILNEQIRII